MWLFLVVSEEVQENETASIDRRLLLALRTTPHDPIGPRWLEESARDVTALGGFTFLILFVAIALAALAFYGKRRQALVLGATMLLAELSSDLLKVVYDRARPDLVAHASYVYTRSFPSGHSTLSAAAFFTVATILASLEPRRSAKVFVFAIAALLVATIGSSRVYLGVHWPSDVLAGWTLGTAWALAARLLLTATLPKRSEAPAAASL